MSNRNRKSNVESTVNASTANVTEVASTAEVASTTEVAAEVEKLTSFNVTASVLRKQEDGSYKFVLAFRPTVRGKEFWGSLGAAVKSHIKQPKTVERTDDHLIVADAGEDEVVTHWAIIRSSQRCPICGQPKQTPSDWCSSEFCEAARVATPTEKKQRRVEDPNAIDF